MLVFTNRTVDATATDAQAFGASFDPGAARLAVADVGKTASGWAVSQADDDVTDADALNLLLPLMAGTRPVLVYVHGNNNTPSTCFERLGRMASAYPAVQVIGFSWPSEGLLSNGSPVPGVGSGGMGDEGDLGKVRTENRTTGPIQQKIRRYHQAQTNAKDSIDALARFLRLVATARLHANQQPFTLAVHSLGVHMLQYSLEVSGATESLGTAQHVILLAPCVRAASHGAWLTRFRPRGRTYVTYNRADVVLFGALIADSGQVKLGTDPGADVVRSDAVRYVSFTNAPTDISGHRYFVEKLHKDAKKLFARLFASRPDLDFGQPHKAVYPVGCDPDGSTCYMADPVAVPTPVG